jgi:hypothetical protein
MRAGLCHNAGQPMPAVFMTQHLPTLLLLAQAVPAEVPDGGGSVLRWFLMLLGGGTFLYIPFLLWMAIWCVRKDPEWTVWLWIILIFQPFGALIYFLARWLPGANLPQPDFAQRFLRKGELQRLEIAARQIGNSHQFIELGDALRETGQMPKAATAYEQALAKEPANPQALWGAGWVAFQQEDYQQAHAHLSRLIEIDAGYKFGDVSLLYAKTLVALGRREAAIEHLESHIRRWRHPEALYVLAQLYFADNCFEESRDHLEALIMDINASPTAIARKQISWKSRAQKLLKRLP